MNSNFKATHVIVATSYGSAEQFGLTVGTEIIQDRYSSDFWENEKGYCVLKREATVVTIEDYKANYKPTSPFTEEQLSYLEETYGLVRLTAVEAATEVEEEPFKVVLEDGTANKNSVVWWRRSEGPEQVDLNVREDHQENMREFPHLYCFNKPAYRVIYE